MSDYQHKEGKGMIFPNENATEENKQPHFRGDAMFNGKLVKIAGWKGLTTAGKPKMSLNIEAKEDEPNPKVDGWI
jgi:hypothetical protein